MNPLYLAVAILAAVPQIAPGDGVVLPEKGFQERSEIVLSGGVEQVAGPDRGFATFIGAELPQSDRQRWYLIVYVDQANDPESRLLVRDFERHAGLKQLAEWCKFWVIDRGESPSAEARHAAQQLAADGGDVPTVLVYPNPDHPELGRAGPGGWEYAFERSGYGGDAAMLARNIYDGIRRHYATRGLTEQCPGPHCPRPDDSRPNEPRQPWDWRNDPPPQPMDGPAATWTGMRWEWLLIAAAAVGLWIAWRKGWLEKQ